MHEIAEALPLAPTARTGLREVMLRRALATLRHGRLRCTTPEGRLIEQRGQLPGPEAELTLHDWRMPWALLLQGQPGFAEAYIDGAWSTPDLTALLTLGALNFAGPAARSPLSAPLRALGRLRHAANANTRAGARRNIMAHYDLGNEFYRLWLDPEMLYSSAFYETPEDTLETAQARKLALIADWLAVPPEGRVLEIGCGWGALARHLAAAGADVTGLTISPAQLAHARQVIRAAGLDDRANLALRDYRDETGHYDRIVSIEMLEAVGEAYWPSYFRTLRARLNPGGRAVLQVITIAAEQFADYRRNADFIQRRIFPGGMLPTKAGLAAQASLAGLKPGRVHHFGASYARTLAEWRARFTAAWPTLETLGFDTRFRRLWNYYLCYCEAGFATGRVDVGLYEFLG